MYCFISVRSLILFVLYNILKLIIVMSYVITRKQIRVENHKNKHKVFKKMTTSKRIQTEFRKQSSHINNE